MSLKDELLDLLPAQGVLPLYFYKDEEVSLEVLRTLYRCGIKAVEYTNRGEAAFANFSKMVALCNSEMPEMRLGIGTIKNGEAAKKYIDAGAHFIVSPGLVEDVAAIADEHNLLWVPGCMTPTEIIRAENLGAKIIKLFPGNLLGPSFLSAVKSLFPDLLFMPTGGVELDKENIAAWFKSGVCAVGMGSKLLSKPLLDNKNYSKIEELTKEAISIVSSVR